MSKKCITFAAPLGMNKNAPEILALRQDIEYELIPRITNKFRY